MTCIAITVVLGNVNPTFQISFSDIQGLPPLLGGNLPHHVVQGGDHSQQNRRTFWIVKAPLEKPFDQDLEEFFKYVSLC